MLRLLTGSSPEEEVPEFRVEAENSDLSGEVEGILPPANGDGVPEKEIDLLKDKLAQPPRMKRLELEQFCFGNGDSFELGPCSATFLKCGAQSAQSPFEFEECPLGKVFVGKECKKKTKIRYFNIRK